MPNRDCEGKSEEERGLECALRVLNIAEKKARIYARLLTEVSLAKSMEGLACRYEEQKTQLQTLLYGKSEKKNKQNKQNEQGMDEGNEE